MREQLHIKVNEQDGIRFLGKNQKKHYLQMDGRFTNINLSCYSCFSFSILMIFIHNKNSKCMILNNTYMYKLVIMKST
jgi:hypothetical protein